MVYVNKFVKFVNRKSILNLTLNIYGDMIFL
jgi:hypothetical protein